MRSWLGPGVLALSATSFFGIYQSTCTITVQPAPVPYGRMRKIPPATPGESPPRNADEKFLIYFSHGGFGNQIIGLQNAAMLALATNRTLVLPPVTPHLTDKGEKRFPQFEYREIGSPDGCRSVERSDEIIEIFKRDSEASKDLTNEKDYPSFQEIIDFKALQRQGVPLRVIDLPTFMVDREVSSFSGGRDRNISFALDGRCTGDRRTWGYTMVLKSFYDNFWDKPVAMTGSGLFITSPMEPLSEKILLNCSDCDKSSVFMGFPLAPKFLSVLQHAFQHIPRPYVGVHLRFDDSETIRCNQVGHQYEELFGKIAERAPANTTTVFTGTIKENVRSCFDQHKGPNSTLTLWTMDDLFAKDDKIRELAEQFIQEESTISLLMDLFMIAMGDAIVADQSGTFHRLIRAQNKNRETILQLIDS